MLSVRHRSGGSILSLAQSGGSAVPVRSAPSHDRTHAAPHARRLVSRPLLRVAARAAALLAPACIPRGLSFVADDRVQIVSPEARSSVGDRVTVRWTVDGFDVTGRTGSPGPDTGYFGVFVDRPPVPPGRPLSWVAHGDRTCATVPGCPDRDYLAAHDTYATSKTSFTIDELPDLHSYHGHEFHEVTIVLLDGAGRRIGEGAWHVDFFHDRNGD